jgi:glutathionylspermidine synthase
MNTKLEKVLQDATVELHQMFLQATEHVIKNPSVW